MPPTQAASIPHDDWVSDVSCVVPGKFLTASYDGLVRVFDSSQQLEQTIQGHTGPITAICLLRQKEQIESGSWLLSSSSQDGTARLSTIDFDAKTSKTLASLHLHSSPVSSIAASSDQTKLITADWDALLGVWDTRIPEDDEVPLEMAEHGERSKKRRRTNGSGDVPKRKAPLAVLKSHTNRITEALFSSINESIAYSCSLDSTIRSWDVEAGVCVETLPFSNAPFLSLAHLASPNLLASSSTDRVVRVIDTRIFNSRTSSLTISASNLPHTATPTALAASPVNGHHLASGAYDGVVRIWDVRSVKTPISSFRVGQGVEPAKRGDAKVLGLDWTKGVLAVGGEAGLDIWRVPEAADTDIGTT